MCIDWICGLRSAVAICLFSSFFTFPIDGTGGRSLDVADGGGRGEVVCWRVGAEVGVSRLRGLLPNGSASLEVKRLFVCVLLQSVVRRFLFVLCNETFYDL
jgi:hypothetical protein